MNHFAAKYNFSCRVCGDDAIGFHFGGFSCESCKAFFRRNAFKRMEFSCKQNGNCHLDKITRRYCSYCRLNKCLAIGMNTEFIKSSGSNESQDRNQLHLFDVTNWSVNYCLTGTLRTIDFQASEFEHFSEIHWAMSAFCDETKLPISCVATDISSAFGLMGGYIQSAITFCKKLAAFKCMKHEDQLMILKRSFSPLISLRVVFMYDQKLDGFPAIENKNQSNAVYIKLDMLNELKEKNLGRYLREFNVSFQEKMENDVNIRNLISGLIIFKKIEANLSCSEFVRYQYFIYNRLLQRYLLFKYRNKSKADERYFSILVSIQMLDFIDTVVQQIYSHCNTGQQDKFMKEIFDL